MNEFLFKEVIESKLNELLEDKVICRSWFNVFADKLKRIDLSDIAFCSIDKMEIVEREHLVPKGYVFEGLTKIKVLKIRFNEPSYQFNTSLIIHPYYFDNKYLIEQTLDGSKCYTETSSVKVIKTLLEGVCLDI